jgi:hypothetical protein
MRVAFLRVPAGTRSRRGWRLRSSRSVPLCRLGTRPRILCCGIAVGTRGSRRALGRHPPVRFPLTAVTYPFVSFGQWRLLTSAPFDLRRRRRAAPRRPEGSSNQFPFPFAPSPLRERDAEMRHQTVALDAISSVSRTPCASAEGPRAITLRSCNAAALEESAGSGLADHSGHIQGACSSRVRNTPRTRVQGGELVQGAMVGR